MRWSGENSEGVKVKFFPLFIFLVIMFLIILETSQIFISQTNTISSTLFKTIKLAKRTPRQYKSEILKINLNFTDFNT